MPFDDPAARPDHLGGIQTQPPQRSSRLGDHRTIVIAGRACHISQSLDRVHLEQVTADGLSSHAVAVTALLELVLAPLDGDPRPLGDWLTTFHLATVALDPYTNESSWILGTAKRILDDFRGADVRVNFLVTADAEGARSFLGPLADEFLVFVDPDRTVVKGLGLTMLPAFVFVRLDGTVHAAAEGWNPIEWRAVAESIAEVTAWTKPVIPTATDPLAFAGTAIDSLP